MPKYRAENLHLYTAKQVKKVRFFLAPSDEVAKERFADMRKKDSTIQEAGLFRVKGNVEVAEYIGYI